MNTRRISLIVLVLSLILFFGYVALPQSTSDAPATVGGISMLLFFVSLIALIVSSAKAKRNGKATRDNSATPQPSAAPVTKENATTERIHVRGVDNYRQNIESVAVENSDYDLTKRELIDLFPDERVWQYTFDVNGSLVPEPDNPYDPNAIMVQADGLCIGYVPKGSTSHVRKLMDSGRIKSTSLDIGGGAYKYICEGDDDNYEIIKDERPYSAVLELHLTDDGNA